ncbi:hypothetical protein [Methylobacterium nigriterrae]|uniref:hypothetical protein n=1 Tax=Methylobacterium nigriterrae TaxID=3127512 RepID=UPI0030140B71
MLDIDSQSDSRADFQLDSRAGSDGAGAPDRAAAPEAGTSSDEGRLARSVAATLRAIAAACAEREAPPVHAARRRLAEAHGAARLRKRLDPVLRPA